MHAIFVGTVVKDFYLFFGIIKEKTLWGLLNVLIQVCSEIFLLKSRYSFHS